LRQGLCVCKALARVAQLRYTADLCAWIKRPPEVSGRYCEIPVRGTLAFELNELSFRMCEKLTRATDLSVKSGGLEFTWS